MPTARKKVRQVRPLNISWPVDNNNHNDNFCDLPRKYKKLSGLFKQSPFCLLLPYIPAWVFVAESSFLRLESVFCVCRLFT